jgi:hypothetical protein
MDKLIKFVSNKLGLLLREVSDRLVTKESISITDENIFDVAKAHVAEAHANEGLVGYRYCSPHTVSSFTDGMKSNDYRMRHDSASKLLGWYLYQGGSPLVEELVLTARVLLEGTQFTEGDVSFLVGTWIDQVKATTDEERDAAVEREEAIYQRLSKTVTK